MRDQVRIDLRNFAHRPFHGKVVLVRLGGEGGVGLCGALHLGFGEREMTDNKLEPTLGLGMFQFKRCKVAGTLSRPFLLCEERVFEVQRERPIMIDFSLCVVKLSQQLNF